MNTSSMYAQTLFALTGMVDIMTREEYISEHCTLLNQIIEAHMEDSPLDSHTRIEWQDFYKPLKEELKRLGIKVLGSGYFAMAVRVPNLAGKVIKIGFKKEDSGAAYAAYCRANKRLNLSDVQYVTRYKSVYMIVMPEYQKFNDVLADQTVSIEDTLLLKLSYDMVNHYIEWGSDYSIEQVAVCSAKRYETFAEILKVKEVFEANKEYLENLKAQSQAIREYFQDIASFDIHDENVMVQEVDGKYHLIITDPVSWSKGTNEEDC